MEASWQPPGVAVEVEEALQGCQPHPRLPAPHAPRHRREHGQQEGSLAEGVEGQVAEGSESLTGHHVAVGGNQTAGVREPAVGRGWGSRVRVGGGGRCGYLSYCSQRWICFTSLAKSGLSCGEGLRRPAACRRASSQLLSSPPL